MELHIERVGADRHVMQCADLTAAWIQLNDYLGGVGVHPETLITIRVRGGDGMITMPVRELIRIGHTPRLYSLLLDIRGAP